MITAALLSSLPLLATVPIALGSIAPGDDGIALAPAWKRVLGSGYSRVAADEDLVVTQCSEGEEDFVVALEPEDGTVRWKHRIGATYLGHDGSEDGPISTPVLGAELVHALGPRGRLHALDRATGASRWTVHLVDELGSEAPEYGFTTTPVLEEGVLVVQAGGSEGRGLCGLDAVTGELRWSLEAGGVDYQSPALLELSGRRQLVVIGGRGILGVAPTTGELLWEYTLAEGDDVGTGRAGAIDDARFFAPISGQLVVYELIEEDGAVTCEEVVRSRELGRTYARPVYHEGHLYGFKSTFLTCVNAETGRRVWKSRPPGGHGLVLVDDRLVVFGAEGVVVVVRATPEGYVEENRVQALELSGYAWPTVASGRVFVRNAEELACLTLERDAAPVTLQAKAPPAFMEGAFAGFVAELESAPDAAQRVSAFLAEQETLPIVEEGRVHFLYEGEAEDVAVVGSMTGGTKADALQRVAGTNLFYRTYAMEAGARWAYGFQVDFEGASVDPRNPRTTPGRRSPQSEVVGPAYRPAAHLAEPSGPRGTLREHEYASEQLGNRRALAVYLPAGYEDGEARYPLLIVQDGPDWLEKGHMTNSLDNLIAAGTVRPIVVAFIAPLDEWWYEAGGSRTEAYLTMLATELVPYLEERFQLTDDPAQRALAGVRGHGLTSALAVATHPDVFGRAAAQSVSLEDVARHALFERLRSAPPEDALFYVDWNRYEARDPDLGWDYAEFSHRLVAALGEAGCTVVGGEALDAHGWGGWSARTDDVLRALFPAE